MRRYLLDTNTVSHALRGQRGVLSRLARVPMAGRCLSTLTEGELSYGLARRPDAVRLAALVDESLRRVDVLPWDRRCSASQGRLRAALGGMGKSLAPLDRMIAARADTVGAALVSSDLAFSQLDGMRWEDWAI